MQGRPDNFRHEGDDPEATLVTPRFDAEEASRAHPVVPLAEVREPYAARPRARRGVRRPWPPALLAVALLAVVAVGGVVASKVLRRAQPTPEAAQTPAAARPAQAAGAPAPAEPLPTVEAPREVADAKPEPRATRTRRAGDARRAVRGEGPRDGDEDFEDWDKDRRDEDRGKRRKRSDDDGENEMREALKDAKKKVPRLVDVLVKP
jgi:hypothetical protein